MNAQQLKDFLVMLEKYGHELSEIEVNFRHDYDSDVIPLRHINEDLFDESNNKLTSICLLHTEDDTEEENEDNY
jgi:hypothetical protein